MLQGQAELAEAKAWADSVFDRALNDIETRAARALRPIDRDEAELWLGVLTLALSMGMARAFGVFQGDVRRLADKTIAPAAFDKKRLMEPIIRFVERDDVREFLEAAALEAIDPSSPFGNELVSSIATGWILHAFVARRDQPAAAAEVGTLAGQVAIFDTPMLFLLLDEGASAAAVRDAIAAAGQIGVDIVVAEHTLDELNAVLARVQSAHLTALNDVVRRGANPDVLQRFVDEPLIEIYVRGLTAKRWTDWSGFRNHLLGLRARIGEIGIRIIAHGNESEDRVDDCFAELSKQILEHSRKGRGPIEIRRDANTMALAWRIRRQGQGIGVWPRAWIVTTDTHIAPAYRRLETSDPTRLTISPSQWIAVLSAFVPPADLDTLAQSAANFLAQEVVLRIAVRFPPDVAMSMAMALSGDDSATETDISLGQLSLDELINGQPDLLGDPAAAGATLAAAIVARRAQRVAKAQAYSAEKGRAERAKAAASIALTAKAADIVKADLGVATERVTELELEKTRLLETHGRDMKLQRRTFTARSLILGMALVTIAITCLGYLRFADLSADWGLLALGVASGATTVLTWARSRAWVSHIETNAAEVLAGVVAEVVWLVAAFAPYIIALLRPTSPS